MPRSGSHGPSSSDLALERHLLPACRDTSPIRRSRSIDERDYWLDPDVLANCPRIYGVYVFDRKQHFHICSCEPCHELHFLGSQYDEAEELQDDEYRRDEINGKVLDGDAKCELVSYWSKADIDRMLETEIAEGWLPPEGKHGGYRLTGIVSVTADDAIEEARDTNNGSPL